MYNGWANYETWSVALWLGGDEHLYRKCLRFAETGGVTDTTTEQFVISLLPLGTPDFKSPADYRQVRWSAITRFIRELSE